MNAEPNVVVVNVFTEQGQGGNPCPIVLDASSMASADMQALAQRHGLESAFLLPKAGYRLRYFVPAREMDMCGHATLGTAWLLRERRLAQPSCMAFQTLAGEVVVDMRGERIRIAQPAATVQPVDAGLVDEVLRVLDIRSSDLATPLICNAATSRPKTLVQIASCEVLDRMAPRFEQMKALCDRLGSTGIYPFALSDEEPFTLEARQFPQASGYPEDAATGIAATALFGALGHYGIDVPVGETVNVLQGRTMGRLSRMCVMQEPEPEGMPVYWLSGDVTEQAV
ncbi:PhzF family phenazine biosynthesis protein [Bordetella genomosp. 13]|uniref:PhzF family phenazine biosynthesis protein n=1 Tax=Bordetella genomosp. 13 TaxID=463040 RepID=UPI001642B1D9|nr:PhzF family phenazine biosynthesis protein [Bordetella genomosp. 13]